MCAERPLESVVPLVGRGTSGLRIAVAGGNFKRGAAPEALAALARFSQDLTN